LLLVHDQRTTEATKTRHTVISICKIRKLAACFKQAAALRAYSPIRVPHRVARRNAHRASALTRLVPPLQWASVAARRADPLQLGACSLIWRAEGASVVQTSRRGVAVMSPKQLVIVILAVVLLAVGFALRQIWLFSGPKPSDKPTSDTPMKSPLE